MKKLRIMIADDHPLVRGGIRVLIETIQDVELVGEAANGAQALQLIAKMSPDVALLDIAMPELNGLKVTEEVKRKFPAVKVIIVSMHSNPEFMMRALRVGAAGYVLKEDATNELAEAIRRVGRGEAYLSPAVLRLMNTAPAEPASESARAEALTSRQREVLKLLVEGKPMKEIAAILGISIKTVEAHRTQLMDRLQIHDLPGLVRYAMRTGITPPEARQDG